MKICENCLTMDRPDTAVKPFEVVGPEHGNQQGPWRTKLDLCEACSEALQEGDMASFHANYKDTREIWREN